MVQIRVTDIAGKQHIFEMTQDSDQSIVDIAEDAGIELPYSCRSGACFSCCAKIHQGEQRLDREKVGEQLIDVDPDEFLCCIGGIKTDAFAVDQEVLIELEMLN